MLWKNQMIAVFSLLALNSYAMTASTIQVPKVLIDNDFEAAEYQIFVTKTKEIDTTGMIQKLVFEGEMSDYYKLYQEELTKKLDLSQQVDGIITNTQGTSNVISAALSKDVQSLQNFGYAMVGSVVFNALLGSVLGDKHYIQVTDYYKDNKPITRMIKYLISDDSLDKDEMELVFNTTDIGSYHFRSGGFMQPVYWNKSSIEGKK